MEASRSRRNSVHEGADGLGGRTRVLNTLDHPVDRYRNPPTSHSPPTPPTPLAAGFSRDQRPAGDRSREASSAPTRCTRCTMTSTTCSRPLSDARSRRCTPSRGLSAPPAGQRIQSASLGGLRATHHIDALPPRERHYRGVIAHVETCYAHGAREVLCRSQRRAVVKRDGLEGTPVRCIERDQLSSSSF